MDHNRAIEIQAIERYFLGELAPEDREQFEEHYFTCAECGQGVRDAARFRANSRELLRNPAQFDPPERERRNAWWRFPTLVPSTVAFALIGVVSFQNLVTIPALRMPHYSSPLALDGLTRGSLPHLDEGMSVDLQMAPPTAAEGQEVEAELVTDSGKVIKAPATVAKNDQPLQVSFPGKFRPGRYTVYVREIPSERILFEDHFEIAKENKANE